ncbi:MAG: hypothetical protein JWQ90_2753 [Hydrocarboniphaga sp.]|uniref:hypothetical protein n=1 Tax=Hydrocarboniphaga sp. TaxID=2033016 RepID=UPI00261EE3C9|nr:hypothetical protein [Hydrocarboniphaga sp.]MDB5970303.1 hypothetical protein [Hydrocarboniphaga sp.]
MHPFSHSLAMPVLLICGVACAGPPFATDDPEPAPEGHYEIYLFSTGTHTAEGWDAALPGFELNYGVGPDLQLAAAVEQAYQAPHDETRNWHYGGAEAGLKYRFVHEDEAGWRPQIAFYPSVEFANGAEVASTFLPLWLQKSIGDWEVFGGGGVRLNPGSGHRDTWFSGIGALRPVTGSLELGAEVFRETPDGKGGSAASGCNLAAVYAFNERWHVVASAGRGITRAPETNEFSYYLGLELTPP